MSAMTLPGRAAMTTTRSERYTASSIWWVTKRTVFFAAFQILSSSACISSRVCASSAAKGSSISRIAESTASARARLARCCMPPESWYGYLSSNPLRPTSSMNGAARLRASPRVTPAQTRPYATLSSTEYQGKRAASWNTIASSRPLATRWSLISSEVAGRRPLTIFRKVDFPQPLGPRRLTNAPSGTSRSTFSIARSVFPVPRSRYCICTPRAERARCPLLTSRGLFQVQARTPALQIPLRDADGFGQNNAEHGEDQDAEEHPVALQRGFGPRDHHAKTRGLRVELGDDHAREDAADREPDAAHDEGQRSRDHEGREDEPLRRAEASRDVEELAIDGPYAFDRGQDDREQAGVRADLPRRNEADDPRGAEDRALVAAVPAPQRVTFPPRPRTDDAERGGLGHRAAASSFS